MRGYDVLGNIVLIKFDRADSKKQKLKEAKEFLASNKHVTTVLEKTDKIKGRLRTPSTKFITGIRTKEAVYKENGCFFQFDIEKCYFSPRLSSERGKIAEQVKKGEEVLVLFAGVAPFPIIIAKTGKPKRVVSVELGREASKYAKLNAQKNKVVIEVIQGDVRKQLPKMKEKFDRIVMARPNLEDSFLDVSFPLVKKGGIINYYGFYPESEIDNLKKLILDEAKAAKRKIKIISVTEAGNIGVRAYRYRVDIRLLN